MAVASQSINNKKKQIRKLFEKGQHGHVIQLCQKLINRGYEDEEVWLSLAKAERMQGNLQAVELCLKKILSINPNSFDGLMELGLLFETGNMLDKAIDVYRKAITLRPSEAEPYWCAGKLCKSLRRYDEALAYLEKFFQLNKSDVVRLSEYGDLLSDLGKSEQAIVVYEALVNKRPTLQLWLKLATAQLSCGHNLAARKSMNNAANLEPSSIEVRLYEIMQLRFEGALDEAAKKARSLFEEQPSMPSVVMTYSKHCQRLGDCGRVLQSLERLLDSGVCTSSQALLIKFQLGRLYDKEMDYDKAFHYYKMGNDEAKGRYDSADTVAANNQFIEIFDSNFFELAQKNSLESKGPVFIVGMPRSGTTLLERILDKHSCLHGAGELKLMSSVMMMYMNKIKSDGNKCLSENDIKQLASVYLSGAAKLAGNEVVIVDKMPDNYKYLGLIALLFPNAKILHCVRSPIDTCLSAYFVYFHSGNYYSYDLNDLVFHYKEYKRLMAHWRNVLPMPILNVEYERMVEDQESQTRRVLEFLGLNWESECLHFYKTDRVALTASHAQVDKPIFRSSVGRWRNYDKHLEVLKKAFPNGCH